MLRITGFIMIVLYGATGYAQTVHPHILVKPEDRQAILDKIDNQPWAKKVFDDMVQEVTPYVHKHQTDTGWILGRYLMNRVPGKRYTHFYADEDGTELVRYGGDAPFPTVRVSPHKRQPLTADGYSYKTPTLEELVPYDTSMTMLLTSNAPGNKKERVNPQSFVESINGRINQLALDAAIIYWLTGKEEYARFAADIVNQWARGASFQQPITGPCRTGFLSIQTLGDGQYRTLTLAYDFLYNYLRDKKYETSWYEGVFEKIAHTMTFRGFWNNNWFAAQTPAMIFAALSLENKQQRDYYINFYLSKDTVNGGCGHLAIPSVIDKWLTPDGHWKEPGGYHNFPVGSLLVSALAMEKNGYNVFGQFPALFQSSFVLLKYSFPNFMAPSIGDTGPVSQSPDCLEIGISMAQKYNNPLLPQLTAAMDVLVHQKGYKRESTDYTGLLSYLPSLPAGNTVQYTWPRSGALDFAKCYLQRNGTDRQHGLMYLVQGATYNHNHANGMSLELYGAGSVMGVDPGKGLTYEAPMHVNYYAQWAAHNTVVSGAASGSVPLFTGGGGSKKIGAIQAVAMEPLAGATAVSPYCSFTDTRYTDISTNTAQQRTLAIIRTSDSTGYYVDVYRSANATSNEYVYHNIGNSVQLLDMRRKPVTVNTASFPIHQQPLDAPGFRNIQDYRSTGVMPHNITALFSLQTNETRNRYMQVLFAGEGQRTFYTCKGPASGTADAPYRTMPTPVIVARQEGEAWKHPFVAVYEPFTGNNNYSVDSIALANNTPTEGFTALRVFNKNNRHQLVLQSIDEQLHQNTLYRFNGFFGVAGIEKNKLKYLYLGDGKQIGYQQYTITANTPHAAAQLTITGNNRMQITCNQETTITIKDNTVKKVTLTAAGKKQSLALKQGTNGVSFTVPKGEWEATSE